MGGKHSGIYLSSYPTQLDVSGLDKSFEPHGGVESLCSWCTMGEVGSAIRTLTTSGDPRGGAESGGGKDSRGDHCGAEVPGPVRPYVGGVR